MRERLDGMTADPSSSSSSAAAAPSVKGVSRALAQHHRAVVAFLFGFFVILVLYTTASGQFGTPNTIGEYGVAVVTFYSNYYYQLLPACGSPCLFTGVTSSTFLLTLVMVILERVVLVFTTS